MIVITLGDVGYKGISLKKKTNKKTNKQTDIYALLEKGELKRGSEDDEPSALEWLCI